jgi:hypothetical protein
VIEELEGVLKASKVALAIDGVHVDLQGYEGVVVIWVDKSVSPWRLRDVVLNVAPFAHPHTKANVTAKVIECFERIPGRKGKGLVGVVTIVYDGASVHDFSEEECNEVRCFLHMLAALVKKATAATKGLQDLVNNLKRVLERVRLSAKNGEELARVMAAAGERPLRPVRLLDIRWLSLLPYLKRAVSIFPHLSKMDLSKMYFKTAQARIQWLQSIDALSKRIGIASLVTRLLDRFGVWNSLFQTRSTPTSSLVLMAIDDLRGCTAAMRDEATALKTADGAVAATFASQLLNLVEDDFGNFDGQHYRLAALLDIRTAHGWGTYVPALADINALLKKLGELCAPKEALVVPTAPVAAKADVVARVSGFALAVAQPAASEAAPMCVWDVQTAAFIRAVGAVAPEHARQMDPLAFLSSPAALSLFPLVAAAAAERLTEPAGTAVVEAAFSGVKRVLSVDRTRLRPARRQALSLSYLRARSRAAASKPVVMPQLPYPIGVLKKEIVVEDDSDDEAASCVDVGSDSDVDIEVVAAPAPASAPTPAAAAAAAASPAVGATTTTKFTAGKRTGGRIRGGRHGGLRALGGGGGGSKRRKGATVAALVAEDAEEEGDGEVEEEEEGNAE